MQKRQFVISCFALLSILVLASCKKEKITLQKQKPLPDFKAIEDAREWFNEQTGGSLPLQVDAKTKSSNTISQTLPLQGKWDESKAFDHGKIKNVEVPVYVFRDELANRKKKCSSCLKSGKHDDSALSRSRLVIQSNKETGKTRGFMMTVMPDENYSASGKSIEEIDYYNRGDDFSGLIVFNHLDGTFANAWRYRKGEIQKAHLPPKPQKKNGLKSISIIEVTHCYHEIAISGGYTSYSRDCRTKRQYVFTTSFIGGGGGFNSGPPSSGFGATGGGSYLPNRPLVIENDPSFVNTAADCVKQKLDQENIINDLLAGFKLDKSQIDVTFKVGQLDSISANGRCVLNKSGNMNIIIDKDHLSAPSLSLAQTILHECFHAYIFGKINEEKIHNGLAPEPNFSQDWEQYQIQHGDDAQHNYIADKYINYMKRALKSFYYLSVNKRERQLFEEAVKNNSDWKDVNTFLKCMTWSGLHDTNAWDDFIQKKENQKNYSLSKHDFINEWPSENCK